MIRSPIHLAFLVIGLSVPSLAGEDLRQSYRDLANDAVVMNISAHPDDEDGATLAYYRMKTGAKTYSVLFTRGEGGQNEIGPELYEELAVIRTEETLRAGRILGAHVDFLNLSDFGYSRTATEAFRFWGGREEVLRRLVYFIRKYKPDVLFTNHSTGGGHGHHQAVAVTAIAAFDAAADPDKFPEQLSMEGVSLWQPAKPYIRIFPSSGGRPDVSHPVGETHDASGETYLDIASRALREHKSQGMESANLARFSGGVSLYRLARTNSSYQPDTSSFLGGISFVSENGENELGKIRAGIDKLVPGMEKGETIRQSSEILAGVRQHLTKVKGTRAKRILQQWEEELEHLIVASAGISFVIAPDDEIVVPGQEVILHGSLSSDNPGVSLSGMTVQPAPGWKVTAQPEEVQATLSSWRVGLVPGPEAVRTLPKVTQQYRPIEEECRTGVSFHLVIDGRQVSIRRSVVIDVAPSVELTVSPHSGWFAKERASHGLEFDFTILNRFSHKTAGRVDVVAPDGWRGSGGTYLVQSEDGVASGKILVTPEDVSTAPDGTVRFVTEHMSASSTVRLFDVTVPPWVRLGIVKSYDNTLETVAHNLDIPFELLDSEDISSGDLGRYTSIVLDIRTYAVRKDVREHNERLLQYAREGGNLIVFYQKTQDWKSEYAPYPLELTRERITDEEAPVTVLRPEHPLMSFPNPISREDWSGWVQERGVYFPGNVSPEYVRILSSHDPDERPLDTGLLVADTGLGSYIYTSYVWYRQMKEAHAGAIRFFANMISYSRNRQ
jgi:LmbE family N-acetylglucosaminyl deacetylase